MDPDQYIIVKVKHKRTFVKGWRQIMRSPSKKHTCPSVDFQNLNSLYFLADFESCSLAACLFLLLLCLAACSATMSDKSSLLSIASCSRTAASALAVGGNHVWSPTQSLWLSLLIQQMDRLWKPTIFSRVRFSCSLPLNYGLQLKAAFQYQNGPWFH